MNKKIIMTLAPILFVILVVIVSQQKVIKTNSGGLTEKRNTTEELENVTMEKAVVSLVVDPNRCRGCGKCVMLDQEHFRLNGNVAEVISQENLDSKALSMAIFACRDRAISLE